MASKAAFWCVIVGLSALFYFYPSRKSSEIILEDAAQEWTVDRVATWLNDTVGLQQYCAKFKEERIDGSLLFEIEDSDLIELGISSQLHQKRVRNAIDALANTILTNKPKDFWSYRAVYPVKVHLLIVGLVVLPRSTILYLYLYERETILYPLFTTPDTSFVFWLFWLCCPHLLCAYYALPYFSVNRWVVPAFISIFCERQILEFKALVGNQAARNEWIRSPLGALIAWIFVFIMPSAVTTFFLYVQIFFGLAGLAFGLFRVYNPPQTRPTPAVVSLPPHFPPPLEIPPLPRDLVVPTMFQCPISHEIMVQPTVTDYGHSYDFNSISQWLHTNQTDPMTNQPLNMTGLKPNRGIRDAIEQWVKAQNVDIV